MGPMLGQCICLVLGCIFGQCIGPELLQICTILGQCTEATDWSYLGTVYWSSVGLQIGLISGQSFEQVYGCSLEEPILDAVL